MLVLAFLAIRRCASSLSSALNSATTDVATIENATTKKGAILKEKPPLIIEEHQTEDTTTKINYSKKEPSSAEVKAEQKTKTTAVQPQQETTSTTTNNNIQFNLTNTISKQTLTNEIVSSGPNINKFKKNSNYTNSSDISNRFALSTNLLYWAIAMPNIEIEGYATKRLSIALNGYYGWWSRKNRDFFYHIAAGGIEAKYWLNNKSKYHGHYIGCFANYGMYDICMGLKHYGYQADYALTAGVSYGYSFPISKRVNMTFAIGVGYVNTLHERYKHIDDCYVFMEKNNIKYFGPNYAKVGLTIPFNLKRYDK